jgi:hypothetical protein
MKLTGHGSDEFGRDSDIPSFAVRELREGVLGCSALVFLWVLLSVCQSWGKGSSAIIDSSDAAGGGET